MSLSVSEPVQSEMEKAIETVSERGKLNLVYMDNKFCKAKMLKSGETMWRCCLKTCKASVYTVGEDHEPARIGKEHNHECDLRKLNRQVISAAAKRQAMDDVSARPGQIFDELVQKMDSEYLQNSDVRRIKDNMWRARRKFSGDPSKMASAAAETLSERGKLNLIYKNYKFSKGKMLKSGETMWRCCLKTCKASVYTVGEDHEPIRIGKEHNHESDLRKLNRQVISATAKRQAMDDIDARPSEIFDGLIQKLDIDYLENSDVSQIKDNIYRARSGGYEIGSKDSNHEAAELGNEDVKVEEDTAQMKQEFIPEISQQGLQSPLIDMDEVDNISTGKTVKQHVKSRPKKRKILTTQKKPKFTDMLQTVIDAQGNFVYTKMKDNDPVIGRLLVTVKSRMARSKKDLALLEGKRLIRDALMANCRLDSLIFSRKDDVEDIKDVLPKSGANLYKISYKEIQMWSDLSTTPGIMGIFKTPQLNNKPPDANCLPITIVCDNVREPGNLGAILRVAAGVGVEKVLLTKGCVDVWDTKVLRSAAGCHFRIPIAVKQSWPDINAIIQPSTSVLIADNRLVSNVADVNGLNQMVNAIPLLPYYGVDFHDNPDMLLVIGGETEGLSEESYRLASAYGGIRLNIPLSCGVESLNAGVALGVILFEIKRQCNVQSHLYTSADVTE